MTFQAAISNAGPAGEQVLRLDVDGNHIDAHDGDLLVVPDGSFWWYGSSYGCGFQLLTPGNQWCGVKAYRSTDLMRWHDMGLMVPPDATWQARCAMPHYGCFNTHVAQRPSGDYIMWINGFDNNTGYHLLTAPSPGGPWTDIGEPTALAHMGSQGCNGACDLFMDDDGTPWLTYVDLTRSHTIVVEQLNSTLTAGTGQAVDVTSNGEPPALFKRSGVYYLVYGTPCEYCPAPTYVRTAPSPLGPWSAPTQLNPSSCAGQLSWITQVGSQYLLATDQWVPSAPNQGLGRYFWTPLTFGPAGSVLPYTCPPDITITVDGAQVWEPQPVHLDQFAGDYGWRTWCDLSAAYTRLQTFTPAHTGLLTQVSVMAFRGAAAPNAPLLVEVQRATAALNPVGPVLARGTFPDVGWSPTMQTFTPNIPVQAGIRYALVLRTASTTGCYGFAYTDLGPYANGAAAVKPATDPWRSEAPRSLHFAIEVT